MKPNDALSIGELAASFGWSVRFVEGLVRSESIPALNINGIHYFRRQDVVDWLDQKIQTLDASRLNELEAKLEGDSVDFNSARTAPKSISDLLHEGSISLGQMYSSKRMVLEKLTDLAEKSGKVVNREHLLASLIERESLCSTALPGGVAITHPRRPLPLAVTDTVLAFLHLRTPIPFGAEDETPTELFFLIAAQDERQHLHTLSRIARILRSDTIEKLKAKDVVTQHDVLKILTAAELNTRRSSSEDTHKQNWTII
jgi:nitrogen PTS system EIIA component